MAGWDLAVTEALVDGPREVAVVGGAGRPAADGAASRSRSPARAGLVVVAVGDARSQTRPPAPLLADRPLVGGRPAAYPCRGMVCDLPLTDPAALAAWTGARPPTANGLDASE